MGPFPLMPRNHHLACWHPFHSHPNPVSSMDVNTHKFCHCPRRRLRYVGVPAPYSTVPGGRSHIVLSTCELCLSSAWKTCFALWPIKAAHPNFFSNSAYTTRASQGQSPFPASNLSDVDGSIHPLPFSSSAYVTGDLLFLREYLSKMTARKSTSPHANLSLSLTLS